LCIVQTERPLHSRVRGKEPETDIIHSGQIEGRKSQRGDEEAERRGEVSSVVREADADNRAVFFGHELLQRDEPVFAAGEGEGKHPMAWVLHRAYYREMYGA
jgi:hypothetical protein